MEEVAPMTLTNQQFRKLLVDAIEERKTHDRTARSARLLKEGYIPYNEEQESGCPVEASDRDDRIHDRTSTGEGSSKAAWDYNGEWANYLMYLEDEQEIFLDSFLTHPGFDIYLPIIEPAWTGDEEDTEAIEPDISQLKPYICLDNRRFNSIVDIVKDKSFRQAVQPSDFERWAQAALDRASESGAIAESYRRPGDPDRARKERGDDAGIPASTIEFEKISAQGYSDGNQGRQINPRYAKKGGYMIAYNAGKKNAEKERSNISNGLKEEEEEEIPPAPFEEVYNAVWAFFEREGFSPNQDDQDTNMRKIVTDHRWTWEDYARRSVEELEAHEQRVAAMLGTEAPLKQSRDPIT